MSAQHTPGPWGWDRGLVPPDGPERYADIYIDGGETIIANFNDRIPEGLANACLMSAAPDLLESCQEMLGYMKRLGAVGAVISRADSAIMKATGA